MTDNDWYSAEPDENIVAVLREMADDPLFSKEDMAYAAEKPWKFGDVWDRIQKAEAPR